MPKFRPAPSSLSVISISFPSCRTRRVILPCSGLPAVLRAAVVSSPCTTALRNKCSMGAVMRSRIERSISTLPPTISKPSFLPVSMADWRDTRYSLSAKASNCTKRVRISDCVKLRFNRPCEAKSRSAEATVLRIVLCSSVMSPKDSASMRVSSWKRVNRSNSKGSNCAVSALDASSLEDICDSAAISTSRNCAVMRDTLSCKSVIAVLSVLTWDSNLPLAKLTSPAWLTNLSSVSVRRRMAGRLLAMAVVAGLVLA